MRGANWLTGAILTMSILLAGEQLAAQPSAGKIRFATYNCSLNRETAGQLVRHLSSRDNTQAKQVAEIVQRVRADVLLLNEFDYSAAGDAPRLFQENYLAVSQNEQAPLTYPYRFAAPVNTGEPSGLDLDRDGTGGGPQDAWGFGRFPGQYAMVAYSMFPIEETLARTFQKFLWSDMPGAMRPQLAGKPYYPPRVWEQLRLSSKSHWDLPIAVSPQTTIHFLVSHPTPPVFDGAEDRNGCRNHDEIRLWADYVDPARGSYVVDDAGRKGGLQAGAKFIIAGDNNADPSDGDSTDGAALQFTTHPLIDNSAPPASEGAPEDAKLKGGANERQQGNPANDTADFGKVGNLRVDYVLPSKTLKLLAAGVFWPKQNEPGHALIKASDHRAVWIDVAR